MESTRETGVLLSPELHDRMAALAIRRGVSVDELVREACERAYGREAVGRRLEAVRRIASLNLPVGTPDEMKRESVPAPEELCPDPV